MRVVADATGDAKDPILHSRMFFLVDRAGRVRGVYDSDDDQSLQRLASDTRVLSARAAPTASVGAGSAEAGQALFLDLGCSGCHDNPRLAPSLRGAWGRQTEFAGGGHTIMDAAYVRESIVAPGAKVVDGYLNLMPAYANEMSAAELDNLIEYVRSLAAVEVPPVGASTLPSPALTALPPLKPTAVEHSIAVRAPTQLEKDPPSSSSAASAPGVGARIAIDPVCGMSVRADPSTPHAVQAGQDYYFCSESCREQFVTDPSKYAAKPRSAFP
jgi:YHS domain-containing protein/cytochrome c551/c552